MIFSSLRSMISGLISGHGSAPGSWSGKLEKDDALQNSELGSGDGASVAGCGAPMSQGVGQILDQVMDLACGGVLRRNGPLPEERIT